MGAFWLGYTRSRRRALRGVIAMGLCRVAYGRVVHIAGSVAGGSVGPQMRVYEYQNTFMFSFKFSVFELRIVIMI